MLLRETVIILRSKDEIRRGAASFPRMVFGPMSVITPELKKNEITFLTHIRQSLLI